MNLVDLFGGTRDTQEVVAEVIPKQHRAALFLTRSAQLIVDPSGVTRSAKPTSVRLISESDNRMIVPGSAAAEDFSYGYAVSRESDCSAFDSSDNRRGSDDRCGVIGGENH